MRLVVIGGGAAGFFCAVTAARLNRALEVVLVEKTGKLLSKVRISGGGRCNVTHACFSIPEMIGKYPRGGNFVKKTFHQFFTTDTVDWFKQRGVLLKTEPDGRMFPVTDSSGTIIECLIAEADKYNVDVRLNREVKSIRQTAGTWELLFSEGELLQADMICAACGGYPKDFLFGWLKNTGHSVQPPVPSLFTFNLPGNQVTALMGVSAEVKIKVRGTRLATHGPLLITHWGVSGPAVLRLSAEGARYMADMNYRFTVAVNWCPLLHEQSVRDQLLNWKTAQPAAKVSGRNGFALPQRLWEHLCGISGIGEVIRWGDLSSALLNRLAATLTGQEFAVEGKTTFKEEFVTAGGISLSEINPQTMESRLARGLFFAGEIMDVDGITGGFNFQHAWTSGWIAGKSSAEFHIFAPPN